jgi:hypothetical protein
MRSISGGCEAADLRAEDSTQDAHGSMDVRFDRSDRLVENLGDLRVTATFDEPQGCGRSQVHRELQKGLLN